MEEKQLYAFNAENEGGLNEQAQEIQGPVTVLGMTFANDDERREYFRDELRKKLPELRKIEGFPIGEDEDIIRLSDPPYYTACPNPWLNDFIAEWEEEKKQLEAEGMRKADFEVKEPYAADVNGIKNDSVYRSLFYHTKVPQTIIMKYIFHYTQPGDIVFDGFSGSGMTGLACKSCGSSLKEITSLFIHPSVSWGERHAICIDLSIFASLLGHSLNTPKNINLIQTEVNRIVQELEQEYGWMFKTKHSDGEIGDINCTIYSDIITCDNCGCHLNFWNQVVDKKNGELKDYFICPNCGTQHSLKKTTPLMESIYDSAIDSVHGIKRSEITRIAYTYKGKRYEKEADDYDKEICREIENIEIPTWYPTFRMIEGGETRRNDKYGISHTHHFFTKRNLIILSAFLDKINRSTITQDLRYVFTGMIMRSSKLNKVHFTKYLGGGSDWDAGYLKGTLYIPPFSVESSALAQINNKLTRYIKAAPFFPDKYDNCIMAGSSVSTGIQDNSIDYIFIDPPFGSNIAYSELNYLIESWFKVYTNSSTEAIENEEQQKKLSDYSRLMFLCCQEFYRILKPGKWMTVEFSNTNASVWNSLQNAITKAGFVTTNVAILNKGQGGMRSVTTTTAVKQDLAISCYKPTLKIDLKSVSNVDVSIHAWDFVNEYLNHVETKGMVVDEKVTFIQERDERIIFDRLVSYYIQHGYPVPFNSAEFQKGLHERFIERDGMFFTATQVAEYDEFRKKCHGIVPMGIIVSDEANGIEWLKNQLRDNPQTYQQIQPLWMQAIGDVRKGCILPELKTILEENFIEEDGGKWRIPNYEEALDLAKLHHKSLMRQFKYIVEMAQKPRARIKEANPEALREGFKQCFKDRDFATIMLVSEKIPQNMLTEDPDLLQYYDIAQMRT